MVWQRFAKPPGREPVQVRLLPPPLESRGWRIEDRGLGSHLPSSIFNPQSSNLPAWPNLAEALVLETS